MNPPPLVHNGFAWRIFMANSEPVPPSERLVAVDALRGVAVFGILVVNMLFFAAPIPWISSAHWTGLADSIAMFVTEVFFTAKFYTTFALLFGFGFGLQMERAETAGRSFVPTYIRRVLMLLLFGLLHASLVWFGDILHVYALLGLLLIPFRRLAAAAIVPIALVALFIPVGLLFLAALAISLVGDSAAAGTDSLFNTAEAIRIYSSGTWSEVHRQRLSDWMFLEGAALFFFPTIFAMFLAGHLLSRTQIARRPADYRRLLRIVAIAGIGAGIPVNILAWWLQRGASPMELGWRAAWHQAVLAVGAPLLALGYGSLVLLLSDRQRVLAPFAAVGRMALTNYLLQSVIGTLIFYSYGLGLYGTLGPAALLPLAVAIFLVQVPLSFWWVKRFRYGPVEWIWRGATYGRLPALRR
ncbi:MAG: DUF418 domain-containing protein [Thermoanaerobaculia bacterium]